MFCHRAQILPRILSEQSKLPMPTHNACKLDHIFPWATLILVAQSPPSKPTRNILLVLTTISHVHKSDLGLNSHKRMIH